MFVLPATRPIRRLATLALAALFAAGCASAARPPSHPRPQRPRPRRRWRRRRPSNRRRPPPTTAAPTAWAPSSAGPIEETHLAIVERLKVPGDVSLWEAGGDLWTQDRADRVVTNGVPEGEMYRIDPHTGKVKVVLEGVIGGCGVVSDEALWVCTLAGDLDIVSRIDLETNKVDVIRDGLGPGTEPEAIAVTDDAVWIGSNSLGTVQRYDKRTLEPTDSLQLTPAGAGRDPERRRCHRRRQDGVVRHRRRRRRWCVSTSDGHEDGRVTLPTGPVNGVGLVNGTLWAWTPEHLYQLDPTTKDPVDPPGHRDSRVGPGIGMSDIGALELWTHQSSPPRLLQLDPTTLAITKRYVVDNPEPGDEDLDFGEYSGTWWGRKDGEVIRLAVH